MNKSGGTGLAAGLPERVNGRPIWIWGAKAVGRNVRAYLRRSGLPFAGFIDNNTLFRRHAVSFDDFAARQDLGSVFIIIAARQYYAEIAAQCAAHGLREGEDFVSAADLMGPDYQIDLVSVCNLRCPSCPQGNYPLRLPASRMSQDYFRRILDKIELESPDVNCVSLFTWSEPFLCAELASFVALVKERGFACYVSSNLSLECDLESVARQNIEYFRISLSGYYQDTYAKDHARGDMRLVLSNCFKLRYLLDKHQCDTLVEVAYHRYSYNQGEDERRMRQICAELDFSFAPFTAVPLPVENLIDLHDGAPGVPERIGTQRFILDPGMPVSPSARLALEDCCKHNNISILPDGKVLTCCFCFDVERSILAENFLEIPYDEIIEKKRHGKTCQSCLRLGFPLMLDAIIDDTGIKKSRFKKALEDRKA